MPLIRQTILAGAIAAVATATATTPALASAPGADASVAAAHHARHKPRPKPKPRIVPSIAVALNPTTVTEGDEIGVDVAVVAPTADTGVLVYRSANGQCDGTQETADNNSADDLTYSYSAVRDYLSGGSRGSFHLTVWAPSVTAPNTFTICGLLYSPANKRAYATTSTQLTVNPEA
jgi:hypothetical protein